MSEEQARGEVLFGVTLDDLARVHAAERAGVPTEVRLSELGLDRTAFARAEHAWLSRLAASLRDEPALFVAYDLALARAVEQDAPKILPLEEDLGAWISFEGHFQRAADPAEMARSAGLSLSEVARLHGTWAAKLASDPALAKLATTLQAVPSSPLPTIRREPRRPASHQPEAAAPLLPVEALPVPALPPTPIDTSFAFDAHVAREPTTSPSPVVSPVAARPPLVDMAPLAAPVLSTPRWDAATMEVDLSTLGVPAVPFRSGVPGEQAVAGTMEPTARADTSGETADIDVRALVKPVLGFGSPTTPVSVPATVGLPAQARPAADLAGIGTTGEVPADLLARIARGPTPFVQPRSLPGSATHATDRDSIAREDERRTASEPPPVSFSAAPHQSSAFSGVTTDVPVDLLARIARGAAPFEPHPPPKPAAMPPAATFASAARGDHGTSARPASLADGSKRPFEHSASCSPPPSVQASMLTLEQHASLSAELVVFQDRAEAVFGKYGLTDIRQRLTAEQSWRERLRKNPDEQKEWQRLHQHYVAYWTTSKSAQRKR
ncbi:MAG: hypothetical protein U0441_23145 [Polyangiaceae bacterium]